MGFRHGLLAGFSLLALVASAAAQTSPATPLHRAARPTRLAQEQGRRTAPRVAPTSSATAKPPTIAPARNVPHTLSEALAATYSNQPALQAERAKLRATDENVPTALAGWRPTVVLAGSAGSGDGVSRAYNGLTGNILNVQTDRLIGTAQASVTQNLYTGGKTQANVNRSKNQVYSERANLIAQEQTSFNNSVSAYVGVIEAQQLLALDINNEQVLAKQLQATNDRFRVGEITRTDVAQAEAALEGARATRETAVGNLQTARGTFQQIVGVFPPDNLVEPQPLNLPVHSEQESSQLATINNPNVITAVFNDAAAKDAIDVAFSALLPQVSLQGQTFQQNNAGSRSTNANGYQVVAQVSVPLYQGGAEYAAVRQARQSEQQTQRLIDDAKRTAVQNAVQAWDTLAAAKASADSTRAQIRANEVALEGVEREAIVGSRTTLDVLNATQLLLQSRTTLVQNLSQVITASYAVAVAIGRLTARDLHLPVPLYDETAYYQAVKDRWAGLADYATSQPGR
ncbi:TolC family outer membrane protein [Rhodopila sp.]|uniref:TolC family outer membrane protein n=1 Tax=Rhodopila sp. TaxID=2480087 RepID=UPI003D0F3A6B